MVLIIVILITLFLPLNVGARTSQEIEEEIRQKQEYLKQLEDSLNNAVNNLSYYNQTLSDTVSSIPEIEAQIKSLEAEIEKNKIELTLLDENRKLTELKKLRSEMIQRESLRFSYQDWRVKNSEFMLLFETAFDFKKSEQYQAAILEDQTSNILGISVDLKNINKTIEDFENKKAELENLNQSLISKKISLEAQIAFLNSAIAGSQYSIDALSNDLGSTKNSIALLSVEQLAARQQEEQIIGEGGIPPQDINGCITEDELAPNSIKFCGIGNDFVQGHQVGLSQWGAHGMALHGFYYQDILRFYYLNSEVSGGYENTSIPVNGYGYVNIEDYVAGQGEIPSRACGTPQQVNERPDKYVVDNPDTIWDCWPEETIKAQIVAFRSYAIHYSQNYGSICTTAACQVYNGTQYSRWAADETRGQVVLHQGNVIQAMYSADNNQGFGTANSETMFQNFDGSGTAYGYLRASNDSAYATPTFYTTWAYGTRVVSYTELSSMIDYAIARPDRFYGGGASFASYLSANKGSLGDRIVGIELLRDPSVRSWGVRFVGSSGSSFVLGAYWFTYMWNIYHYDMFGNKNDWLWSQTIFVKNGG